MNQLLNDEWINERQWEYYSIQIHILLSNKINEPQKDELINIYDTFHSSKRIVPIQLQEYINLLSIDEKDDRCKQSIDPLEEYKKVLLVAAILRRQETGISKINAIDLASKYFKTSPKIFFEIYSKYLDKAKHYLMVEADIRGLDKFLGL